MEWLGLVVWALIVALALPLALTGSLTSPWLGVQSLFVIAGLACCVLYIALGGTVFAWLSGGLALIAAAFEALGAAGLMSGEPPNVGPGGSTEEAAAALAGFELPLLPTVAFTMILAAAGVTTVS